MAQRYETYKDSGVQWLGEIPGHWGCIALKRIIVKIESGVSANGSTSQAATGTELGVLKTGCVSFRWFNPLQNKLVEGDERQRLACPVKGNTIIVSRMNTPELVGSCAFVDKDYPNLFLPDRLWQVHFNETASVRFLHWMLNSRYVRNRYAQICVGSSSTMQNISQSQFSDTIIPFPPLPEQQAIVSYLDDKCGKIDEWIAQKQKEVELLGEMKQRVIADAVTRGLDPNVKMKRTNIPWLPEVPEHWEIKPIRSLLKESEEKSETGTEELLSLSQYTGITYKKDAGKTGMFEAESTIGYKIVHPGQFVMNIMLAWNGSYAVSSLGGIISPAYCIFNFICECDKMYYDYLLRTKAYSSAFKTESRGIIESRLRLYPSKFYPFHIPVPPLSEQRTIVSFITAKTAKIDKLVENVTREIDNLKEYKQRLISDVVTGQIKVC